MPPPPKCHHAGISRLSAEELLLKHKKDGIFLIRDSETIKGAYTLCLLFEGHVHQYRILPDDSDMIYVQAEKGVQQKKYPDLATLVYDYMNRGLRNGLAYALKYPVEVTESLSDEEEESDDEDDVKVKQSDSASIHSGSKLAAKAQSDGTSSTSSSSTVSLEKTSPTSGSSSIQEMSATQTSSKQTASSSMSAQAKSETSLQESEENNPVRRYITSRYAELDLSRCDSSFVRRLKDYCDSEVYKDSAAVSAGEMQLMQLRQLLVREGAELDRQLEKYLAKIDICRQLFGPITTKPLIGRISNQESSYGLDDMIERFTMCQSALLKLEKKAMHRLLELQIESSQFYTDIPSGAPTLPPKGIKTSPFIPPTSFEVKIVKSGKLGISHRISLEVNITGGKLIMAKKTKEVLDDDNLIEHDKIEQIIKSTSNNCRLDLQIQGRKGKETIIFNDVRERESFCQLIQQMKYQHNVQQEVDRLSLFIGTWNMGDQPAPPDMHNWLLCLGRGKSRDKLLTVLAHDIYVISTQESAMTEKDWVAHLQKTLVECVNTHFVLLASSTLWGIRLVILIKPEYKNKVTHIQQSTVKTGIANALGNKGAAAISFCFNATSFCFISCHLTSGVEKNSRRNQNVLDIIKGLNLGTKTLSEFDITNQFHHVFFLGDLNYRVQTLEPKEIIEKIKQEEYKELLKYDQLRNTRHNNHCLVDFMEEEITFPPTYRFAKDTNDVYVWEKVKKTGIRINAPSWCDRVLYKSYPETYIVNTSYGCVDSIKTSDHKPLYSSFDVGIVSQFAASKPMTSSSDDMLIIFQEVKAEVQTRTKEQFKLEFYSTCLEAPVISKQSSEMLECKFGSVCPRWTAAQIPQMSPLVKNIDYLQDQHILITVKSADGLESYGECVVALRSMFSTTAQPFSQNLNHYTQQTGILTGSMYVKCKSTVNRTVKRSYELIYMDTDTLQEKRQQLLQSGHKSLAVSKSSTNKTTLVPSEEAKSANSYEAFWLQKSDRPQRQNPKPTTSGMKPSVSLPLPAPRPEQMPPPRKPRMGQSSLTSTTVLPVTAPTTPAANSELQNSGQCESWPGMMAELSDVLQSKWSSMTNIAAASVPERKTDRQSPAYDVLRTPSTVNQWLSDLGLGQYTQQFMNNGWKHMNCIKDLKEEHLKDMNILDKEHIAKILKSIASLSTVQDTQV